jgi:hypothetical protein
MQWLSIISRIIAVLAIALLLGWMERPKNTFSPFTKAIIWIGSILALLAMSAGWHASLLSFTLLLAGLGELPGWFWLILAICVGFYFISLRIAYSTIALAQEMEQIKARIQLLDNSITHELREISRQRPDND